MVLCIRVLVVSKWVNKVTYTIIFDHFRMQMCLGGIILGSSSQVGREANEKDIFHGRMLNFVSNKPDNEFLAIGGHL